MIKQFCPNCERTTTQKEIKKIEEINVRGEMIPVELQYWQCEECGEDFEIPQLDYDPLNAAYIEFRRRKGMVQPEALKSYRKELGLSQKEFSDILGIGIATLNRYENGALQSEAHDQMIHLCMQAENLIWVLKNKPELLSETSQNQLREHLKKRNGERLLKIALEQFGSYPSSAWSGDIPFKPDKFFQVIKFFCFNDRVVKTKLMKLLFYADFKHYKEYGVSITGARYAHADHGPVPDQFETWLTAITDWEQMITCDEQVFGDYVGDVYSSEQPDLSCFSTSEIAVLAMVKNRFAGESAKKIRFFSHQESGYRNTRNGELISYQYAQELQI